MFFIYYSPSLLVYNTQEKLYKYINTSFFSIFDRVSRAVFYILFVINLALEFQSILFIYLWFYFTIWYIFFTLTAFSKKVMLNKK